jgi:hypothetical protein
MKKYSRTKNWCTCAYNTFGIALIAIVLFSLFVYVCHDLTGSFAALINSDLWNNKVPYLVLALLGKVALSALGILIIDVKNGEVLPPTFY